MGAGYRMVYERTAGRVVTLPDPLGHTRVAGFTMIELLLAMCIMGVLASIATPFYHDMVDKAKVAKAIGDIRALQVDVQSATVMPNSLAEIGRANFEDPWGNPYVYVKFGEGNQAYGGARKNRFQHPLNTYFDLYSMGKDGATALPLTARPSHDDIVRANDGGFVGLAENY